jgi:competence protein ComEC
LWHKRIWRLHDLIITHPHLDHHSGLPFIAERFRPRRVIVNGEAGEDPSYARLLHLAGQKGATLHTAHSGELVHQGHDFTFTCLGMNGLPIIHAPPLTTNDRSLVFRLQSGGHSFLFPADIGLASEHLLVRSGVNLRADVLLAPHHGSLSSTGQTFLEQVNPKLIVVSASQRRQGFLPAPEHLRQWRQKKIPVLVTGQDGTINCISDGKTLSINAFNGATLPLRQVREEKPPEMLELENVGIKR